MADFVFTYLRKGSHVSSTPWSGELSAAKTRASEGLVRRSADEFEIRSDTLDGELVWREHKE